MPEEKICGPFCTSSEHFLYTQQHRYQKLVNLIINGKISNIPKPKYFIFSPMKSQGLADNQKGILQSLYAAVMTNRILLIDQKKSILLENLFLPNKIEQRYKIFFNETKKIEKNNLTFVEVHSSTHSSYNSKINEDLRKYIDNDQYDVNQNDYDVVKFVGNLGGLIDNLLRQDFNNSQKAGHTFLNNMHPDYAQGCIFNFLFKFTPKFKKFIDVKINNLFGNRSNSIVIASHIRIGDRSQSSNTMPTYINQQKQYLKCIKKIETHFYLTRSSKKIIQFIATDNNDLKQYIKNLKLNKIVMNDIKTVHQRDLSQNNVGDEEMQIQTEQLLLAQSDFLIMGVSGYAEYAASMGFYGWDRVFHFDNCECEINFLSEYRSKQAPLYRNMLIRYPPNQIWHEHIKCGKGKKRGV